MADRCVWMYAIAGEDAPLPAEGVAGVGGGVVRAVRAAGLTAIVSDVAALEYSEAALRRNLEDLDWLERTARAHHGVIEAAAERGPVAPMQLATIYASDAAVGKTLRERAEDLRDALRRASARSEWGVKAYMASAAGHEAAGGEAAGRGQHHPAGPAGEAAAGGQHHPAGPAGEAAGRGQHHPAGPAGQAAAGGQDRPAGPGAAYLLRRRAQLTAQQDARQAALSSAQAVHARLGELSVSSRLYPPQSAELTGHPERMILNAAYLVANERSGEFSTAVDDLAAVHPSIRLVLTGPWPPYSFVADSEDGGRP